MNCTFLGRQISLQNNEESCWTYTLEGDPTFGSKSPQLFFPVTSAYAPSMHKGLCRYLHVRGLYSLADLILKPELNPRCAELLCALYSSRVEVDSNIGLITDDSLNRAKTFFIDSQHCTWRREVLRIVFPHKLWTSISHNIGVVYPASIAPGIGRFVVHHDDTLGILLPFGSGWSFSSMAIRLYEELISFSIAGGSHIKYLNEIVNLCGLKFFSEQPKSEWAIAIRIALLAHMHRNVKSHDLSKETGQVLIDWSESYIRQLDTM